MGQKAFSKFAADFWHKDRNSASFYKERKHAKADGGNYYGYGPGHKDFDFNYEKDDQDRVIVRKYKGCALYYYAEVVGIRMEDNNGRDVALVGYISGPGEYHSYVTRSSKSSKDACQAAFGEVAVGDNDYAARIYIPGFLSDIWHAVENDCEQSIPIYNYLEKHVRDAFLQWFEAVMTYNNTSAVVMGSEIKDLTESCATWCNHFNDTVLREKLDAFIRWLDGICKKRRIKGELTTGFRDYIHKRKHAYDRPAWVISLVKALDDDVYTEQIFEELTNSVWDYITDKFKTDQDIYEFFHNFFNPNSATHRNNDFLNYVQIYTGYYTRVAMSRALSIVSVAFYAKLFGIKFVSIMHPTVTKVYNAALRPEVQKFVTEFNKHVKKFHSENPDNNAGIISAVNGYDSATVNPVIKKESNPRIAITSGRGITVEFMERTWSATLTLLRKLLNREYDTGYTSEHIGIYSVYNEDTYIRVGCHRYAYANIRQLLEWFEGLSWEESISKAKEFRKLRNAEKNNAKKFAAINKEFSSKLTEAAKKISKVYGL